MAYSRITAGSWRSTRPWPRWTAAQARGASRASGATIPTSSSASRPCTTRRWRRRGQARGHDRRQLAAVLARRGRLGRRSATSSPTARSRSSSGYFPGLTASITRSSGARADRPRVAARHLGRSRAARRDVVRPALQPAPGARLGATTGRRFATSGCAAPAPTPAAASPAQTGATARARYSASTAGCRRGCTERGDEPTDPARVGVDRGADDARSSPPGPRSREVLDRIERTAYPGLRAGLTPLALDSKRALDSHRPRRQRLPRLRLRLGLGPARRRAPGAARAGRGGARAVRQRGQPRARLGAHRRARRAAAGGHAGEPDPLRHRAQRHRGGRDRDQADAPRDGPARDPRASTAPTTASPP